MSISKMFTEMRKAVKTGRIIARVTYSDEAEKELIKLGYNYAVSDLLNTILIEL